LINLNDYISVRVIQRYADQQMTPMPDYMENKTASSQKTLIENALKGDTSAQTKIVEDHQKNVYNLGLRLTGREQEAECILQDTFLKVFEKLDTFRSDSQLGTWIHRIATNIALMRMRSQKGKYFQSIEEEIQDDEVQKGNFSFIAKSLDRDPLELTLNDELKERLEEAIASLPDSLRTTFVLKDLEGLSMAEISDETGKSISAVKATLHRARVRLREQLAEFVKESEDE
jgi:RNA polymerase sigma-70 factor, ECF subfamily